MPKFENEHCVQCHGLNREVKRRRALDDRHLYEHPTGLTRRATAPPLMHPITGRCSEHTDYDPNTRRGTDV